MNTLTSREFGFARAAMAGLALFVTAGSMTGCTEAADNFSSEVQCRAYCEKKFDCDGTEPSGGETDDCVTECRNTIENDCGNENQADVNDVISECVDKSCDDFYTCMVFDAAPECLDFVD